VPLLETPIARPTIGIALMLSAMLILPIQDGLAKYLAENLPVPLVVWARHLIHLLLMLPLLLWRFPRAALVPRRPWVQLLRGVTMLASGLLFFGAVAQLPLVDTLSLFFVSPLVVTLLAPLLLGERVGWVRRVAVAVGFVGVLIVLRPGSVVWGPYALMALGSGVMHALYLIVTRKLAGTAPPLVTIAYGATFASLVLGVWVIPRWVPPTTEQWWLLLALGLFASIGHYLVVKAFDYAPATILAPLGYAEIIGATVVGLLVFGDLPDGLTWIGVAVIIGSGVVVSLRERRAARSSA
jgi:drug/metabolite transporter (DMT)-like permease